MDPTNATGKRQYLAQEKLELLTPEQFSYLLAHGDESFNDEFIDDQYERYLHGEIFYDV